MPEKTVYIIRPFGMPFRHTIRQRILSAGLSIEASRELKIPRWAYEAIYPREKHSGVPDEVWMRRLILTTGNLSEAGILEGEDAVARLVRLVGHKPDPAECEVGTIRRDYGASAVEHFGEFMFHLRVMHRPENEEEAAHDLPIIEKLLRT
ncbi:MAG: nucleoside-diphosphate kinase [Patescibacteria group bacterium]